MNLDRVFNIAGMIVVLAIITTLVGHRETKNVIASIGNAFSQSIVSAMGPKSAFEPGK